MILQILFIPLMLILGTIIGVLLALYAFSTHPLLALIVVVILVLIVAGVARWEWVRVGKEMQEHDDNR